MAYEILSDPKKRELYDKGGEKAIKEGGLDSDRHNPMDIFDMFFGMGGRGRSRGPQRGKDVIHQLKVSLEDLYNGAMRKLALQKNIICPKCEGTASIAYIFKLGFSTSLSTAVVVFVSPDESRGYLGFSTVTPPPQRFLFGRDNLKNILVRTFKFGMWVYMSNATNAIVL